MKEWTGHNSVHGYRLLRGVPRGNPKVLKPACIDTKWFKDIHKTFDLLTPQQQTEWLDLKTLSESVPWDEIGVNQTVDSLHGDWAALLVKVLFIYLRYKFKIIIIPSFFY